MWRPRWLPTRRCDSYVEDQLEIGQHGGLRSDRLQGLRTHGWFVSIETGCLHGSRGRSPDQFSLLRAMDTWPFTPAPRDRRLRRAGNVRPLLLHLAGSSPSLSGPSYGTAPPRPAPRPGRRPASPRQGRPPTRWLIGPDRCTSGIAGPGGEDHGGARKRGLPPGMDPRAWRFPWLCAGQPRRPTPVFVRAVGRYHGSSRRGAPARPGAVGRPYAGRIGRTIGTVLQEEEGPT
jgi:hypothetical protein